MKRRDFLKNLGLATAGVALAPQMATATTVGSASPSAGTPYEAGELNKLDINFRSLKAAVDHTVTAVVVGAGSRGRVYGKYGLLYPDSVKMVGVSDINPERKTEFATKHNIPAERQYGDFHEILAVPKFADAMVIALPDDLHFEAAMKAMELGYDVLLEKPMAQTADECRKLLAQSKKTGRILATCHVLRYAPYFIAMREIIQRGMIGEVVSIQHMEPIQYAHMAHSYVRGNWRSSKETTPIILAKSCHDLDILRWMIGKPCESIVADGSIHLFKAEKAPEGAPYRCTDGCPHEDKCPYSAIDIYVRKKAHNYVFDLKNPKDDAEIMEKLRTTGYGRCVYHCDNDQPDHYVANMVFEGGITSSFAMEAFTPTGGRRTRVMGTTGYIEGDGSSFKLTDLRSRKESVWNMKVKEIPEYKDSGHGGGDHALFRDFVEAVAYQDEARLSSTVDVSIESHLMGFAAERSRKTGRKEKIK